MFERNGIFWFYKKLINYQIKQFSHRQWLTNTILYHMIHGLVKCKLLINEVTLIRDNENTQENTLARSFLKHR